MERTAQMKTWLFLAIRNALGFVHWPQEYTCEVVYFCRTLKNLPSHAKMFQDAAAMGPKIHIPKTVHEIKHLLKN